MHFPGPYRQSGHIHALQLQPLPSLSIRSILILVILQKLGQSLLLITSPRSPAPVFTSRKNKILAPVITRWRSLCDDRSLSIRDFLALPVYRLHLSSVGCSLFQATRDTTREDEVLRFGPQRKPRLIRPTGIVGSNPRPQDPRLWPIPPRRMLMGCHCIRGFHTRVLYIAIWCPMWEECYPTRQLEQFCPGLYIERQQPHWKVPQHI